MLDNWIFLKKIYDEGHFQESGGPRCHRLQGVANAPRPVRRHWWNPKWIPFTRSEDHHFCMDFDPAKGGKAGQVLMFDNGSPRRDLLAPSFGA